MASREVEMLLTGGIFVTKLVRTGVDKRLAKVKDTATIIIFIDGMNNRKAT